MGAEGFSPKGFAEHNSVTLSPLHHMEHWSTREHYTALAEHLQECKTQVKENMGTNLA